MSESRKLFYGNADFLSENALPDWQNVFYLPLQSRRAVFAAGHQRWKREHFNGKFFSTWDEKFLYMAFDVRSRAPRNSVDKNVLWREDCFDIILDLREKPSTIYEGDSWHIFMAPPTGDLPGRYLLYCDRAMTEGFEAKTFLNDHGWGGFVKLPWSAFPDFTPAEGAEIALGVLVSDAYGRKNNNPFFTPQVIAFGEANMPNDPALLPRWSLSKKFTPSADNDLSNLMTADFQKLLLSGRIDAPVIIVEELKKMVARIDYRCELEGKILENSSDIDRLQITLPENTYGYGNVKLTVRGADDEVLGVVDLSFRRINGEKIACAQQQVLEFVEKADLADLAENAPGKLAGIFGLLNNFEQLKRLMFLEYVNEIDPLLEEIKLRLELLQDKELSTEKPLLQLLELSRGNESQVSVEFPRYHPLNKQRNDAKIKFHCGGLILATVQAELLENPVEETICREIPALYHREMMPTEDTGDLVFTWQVGGTHSQLHLLGIEALDGLDKVHAVVIAENAPTEHAAAARIFAQKRNIAVISESSMPAGATVLYAGRPAPDTAIGKCFAKAFHLHWLREGSSDLEIITKDDLRFIVRCVASDGCKLVAKAIMEKRAFTHAENLQLAALVAGELQARGLEPQSLEGKTQVVAGDIHSHTVYSDGLLTPLGLVAAAIYSQMDFLMIADHETAEGVLDTCKLFKQYMCKYPLLCAEENSLPDGHLNSYPVKESIMPNLKFEELLTAAHAQGALVQYNHPATYSNRRDLQANGIANSGLEAWEHQLPPHAKDWAELPAQVGSSDCHNTAFPTERTVVCLQEVNDDTFVDAVRRKATGMHDAASEEFVYAPDALRSRVLTALLEPERYLIEPRKARLKKYFQECKLSELYKNTPAATPAELGE